MRLDGRPFHERALAPAALLLVGGATLAALRPGQLGATATLVGLYLVTPLGQEAWLAAAQALFGLPLGYAAAVLLWVSAVQVLFFGMAVHVESLAVRLPRVGARIRRFEERVRARQGARMGLAAALFLVVLLPIHSGGAILASLAGRVMGLGSGTVVAAVLGAIAVRFAVAVAILAGVASLTW